MEPIRFRPTDRVAFVGRTTTGKTYAARLLLLGAKRLVVVDPKGRLSDAYRLGQGEPPWRLAEASDETDRALASGEPVRVRYAAPLDGDYSAIFRRCYDAENVIVYVDEVYGVTRNGQPDQWLTALYTRGAELGIGVWAATQRPRRIPLIVLSESEWTLLFRLKLQADREYMAEMIGPAALDTLSGHEFWLYRESWDNPVKYGRIR